MEPIIVELSNGIRVANFSSPHSFTFTDGTILPAHINSEAERMAVDFIEKEVEGGRMGDISLTFELSEEAKDAVSYWGIAHKQNDVDIVFVPLPMMVCLHQEFGRDWVIKSPFRCIRNESRTNKLVSIDKQCI